MHTEPLLPHFLFLYVGLFTFTNLLPQVLKLHLSITSRKLQLFSCESAPPVMEQLRALTATSTFLSLHVATTTPTATWQTGPVLSLFHCSHGADVWYSFHLRKQMGCLSEPMAGVMNFCEFQQQCPRRLQSPCSLWIKL